MVTFSTPPLRFTPPTMSVSLDRIADFLATVPLFRELDRGGLRSFAELTREQRVAKDAVIFRAGDAGDTLYILRAGEVKLVISGDDSREVIVQLLGIGEHFGEMAVIDGRGRATHAVATEPTTLLTLTRADFRRLVPAHPLVSWALLDAMSQRLRQATSTIGSLVLLDVPGRVAKLLIEQSAVTGPTVRAKPPTHHMLAQMIGASRESVSRAMAEFQENGWITVERRIVTILNRHALEQRALGKS